jgi:hypothetical protein
MTKISLNQGLGAAKAAKQDEFYTQYHYCPVKVFTG